MTTFTESILAPLGHGVVRAPAEATVLVIDDDPAMRDILATVAQQHGFGLQFAEDGAEGLRLAEQSDVDLILLDLSLPGMPGLDVCRRLRGAGVEVPIIILSASTDTVDVVVALEIGADDYIAKPFEIRELAARVNAKLRRQRTTQSQVRPGRLKFPGLIVDIGRHEVLRDGESVNLTPTEFDLLALLSASPGRVISRSEMIQKVWGQGADLDLRSVDAHVYRLRRKIEPSGPRPTYIHAVPGIGYRFERRGLNERLSRSDGGRGDRSSQLTTEVATMHLVWQGCAATGAVAPLPRQAQVDLDRSGSPGAPRRSVRGAARADAHADAETRSTPLPGRPTAVVWRSRRRSRDSGLLAAAAGFSRCTRSDTSPPAATGNVPPLRDALHSVHSSSFESIDAFRAVGSDPA